MRRVGKNGHPIYVYKFRTMHPYSEYLQSYVTELNGYGENGKIMNDFRATIWGKFLRRYWLDELPQLLNVLKGEMKLVGIRPVSERFLNEYPDDLKQLRLKQKPGCVPPYVALKKQKVEEYIETERTYLAEKAKHPWRTDIKYFFWAIYNIVTNKIRSA
jgi:lipopolysaccharide/colanic/teichoic acid biosynthesis glycosyltransferase